MLNLHQVVTIPKYEDRDELILVEQLIIQIREQVERLEGRRRELTHGTAVNAN